MDTVVIGGGIAGLAACYFLQKSGHQALLLEESDRTGGKLYSETVQDCLVEHAADSFLPRKPEILDLIKDLGLESEIVRTPVTAKQVYVWKGARLLPLPPGMQFGLPAKVWPFLRSPLISWKGKLRMYRERFVPPVLHHDDESLASFFERRMGREFLDTLATPLLAGIHSANPNQLSISATFAQFRQMEQKHRSLTRAMKARKKAPASGPPPGFLSLRGGIRQLTDALKDRLGNDLHIGSKVSGIARNGDRWSVQAGEDQYQTKHVVLAVPADCAAPLIDPLSPEAAAVLNQWQFAKSIQVWIRIPRAALPDHPALKGSGILVPPSEGLRVQACTFSCNKFEGRAPDDVFFARIYLRVKDFPEMIDWTDEALENVAIEGFRRLINHPCEPDVLRVIRWPKSTPLYEVGHLLRLNTLKRHMAPLRRLHLTGSSYHGISVPDLISEASQLADQLDLTAKKV